MLCAPLPENESSRLQALRRLLILDTPPEARFDRIIEFAVAEFDVPIALLSFVDSNRQWFKSRVGLDVCETPRDVSFCAHVVYSGSTLVVEDTSLDSRFLDNPLVTDGPRIRFYAGAPLTMPNASVLGTLCLIAPEPRRLDAVDVAILECLRDLAVGELSERGIAHDPGSAT